MLWELILGLLTFAIAFDYLIKRRRQEILKKTGIPGPIPLPIVGNGLLILNNDTVSCFRFLKRMCQKYGKTYIFWAVNECVLFTQDAKYFESILKSTQLIAKNQAYPVLACWLSDGLLLSKGPKWFSRRKIITPAFHFKILEQFVEIFDQQSRTMIKRLSPKADGKTVINMFPEICLTALDIIAETAMGVKINAQENPEFPYVKSVTDCADIMASRIVHPFNRFDWYFRIFSNKRYRHQKQCLKIMHEFTDKVIAERRQALQKSIAEGTFQEGTNAANEFGIKNRMAFIDVLLQSTINGQPLSNQDIREEVDTFMFEGHDTTTSAIAHTCYLLARHPQVQSKVLQEIRDVFGEDREKPVTILELQELKYLECVIKESLRLYPSVPMIGRLTEEDIEINGKTIPANTNIAILIYAANRDPDYFPQPDDFIPERFESSSESADKVNAFANVPFSAGPRNCIGQKFAMLEMKCTISKIVSHFELLPMGEEVQPAMNLILRSATGINIGLKHR
ncbi:putative cytochrome P450 4d14 [Haematobia irritans]|uniref:putative cytochrome P450 4d14 n=1 Tax=Haematobia irritans TaxID=7368 RepID=UPI003F4FC2D7